MLKQHPELFETDSKQSKLPKISDVYTENKHDLPAFNAKQLSRPSNACKINQEISGFWS